MDSTSNDRKSPSLGSLAEQLRLHKGFSDKASKTKGQELNAKRAAVLVCIFEGNAGDLRVILTQRASTLSSHSGEVALPGGKREESDADDVQTALREAKEEIGLEPDLVHVVTVLDPFVTNVASVVYQRPPAFAEQRPPFWTATPSKDAPKL